jgi:hypothetical protein
MHFNLPFCFENDLQLKIFSWVHLEKRLDFVKLVLSPFDFDYTSGSLIFIAIHYNFMHNHSFNTTILQFIKRNACGIYKLDTFFFSFLK